MGRAVMKEPENIIKCKDVSLKIQIKLIHFTVFSIMHRFLRLTIKNADNTYLYLSHTHTHIHMHGCAHTGTHVHTHIHTCTCIVLE